MPVPARVSDPTVRIQLCNRMLAKLGAVRIASLTEVHPAVAAFNDTYPQVRRHELTRHPWKVAMARATLAADLEPPGWGWANAYTLPDDCLRLWKLVDGPDPVVAYALEGGRVLTDAGPPLSLSYSRDLGDAALRETTLFEALAAHLAFELCDRITGTPGRKQALVAEYGGLIEDARRYDAIEGPTLVAASYSPWISSRFGGEGGAPYDGLVSPLPPPEPLDG